MNMDDPDTNAAGEHSDDATKSGTIGTDAPNASKSPDPVASGLGASDGTPPGSVPPPSTPATTADPSKAPSTPPNDVAGTALTGTKPGDTPLADNASSVSANNGNPKPAVVDSPTASANGAAPTDMPAPSPGGAPDAPNPLAPPAPPAGLKHLNPPPSGGVPQAATSPEQERETMANGYGVRSNPAATQPPGGKTAIEPSSDVMTREEMEAKFAEMKDGMDKLLFFVKHSNPSTPDDHIVFGMGPLVIRMSDLRHIHENYAD